MVSMGGLHRSFDYGVGSIAHPGPGFFPLLCSLLLGVFSITLLVSFRPKEADLWAGLKRARVVYVLSILLFYGLLIERLGFFLCNFFALILLFCVIERPKWYALGGASFLIALGFDLFFRVLLQVPFPRGLIGI
jgi:putative tricarboxylic transport membrane protein